LRHRNARGGLLGAVVGDLGLGKPGIALAERLRGIHQHEPAIVDEDRLAEVHRADLRFTRDIERTERYLDSLRRKIVKDSIEFVQAAKAFSDDKNTKDRGGFFTDADGGTKISTEQLDPVVYFTIDTMKVGRISRPLIYRTDDGKSAVRILYFKTKLPPHKANLKDDWFRIQSAAIAEKKDISMEKWFRKARSEEFINIDPLYNSCKILE